MICFLTNFLEIFIAYNFLFNILFCKEILSILLTIFIIFIRSKIQDIFQGNRALKFIIFSRILLLVIFIRNF